MVDKLPTEIDNLKIEIDFPPEDRCYRNPDRGPSETALVKVNGENLPILSTVGLDRWVYSLGKHYVFKLDRHGPKGVRGSANSCLREYNAYKCCVPEMRPCLARIYAAGKLPNGRTWCIQRRIPMNDNKIKDRKWRAKTVDRRAWFTGDMHEENYRVKTTRAGSHQIVWDFGRSLGDEEKHHTLPGYLGTRDPAPTTISSNLFVWKLEEIVEAETPCAYTEEEIVLPTCDWYGYVITVKQEVQEVTIDPDTRPYYAIYHADEEVVSMIRLVDVVDGDKKAIMWQEYRVEAPDFPFCSGIPSCGNSRRNTIALCDTDGSGGPDDRVDEGVRPRLHTDVALETIHERLEHAKATRGKRRRREPHE